MLYLCKQLTLWEFYQDAVPLFRWISTLLAVFVITNCISKYEGNEYIFIITIGLIVFFVGYNSENITNLLLSFVAVVGARGVMFRDIIKVHFIFGLSFCFFNIFGRELGLIPETYLITGNEREGTFGNIIAREDYGYGTPTDFAIHVFYILLDYWILKKRQLKGSEILFYLCVVFFLIYYSDARLASICILLIIILSLSLPLFHKNTFFISYIVKPSFIICIPIFALISVVGTIMYDETDLFWIGADLLFSGRLHLGQDAIIEAGIPMFGQVYEMYGVGNLAAGADYNYIDCSYLQALVLWGVVLSVILIASFVKISQSASRRMDYVLLSAIFLAGLSGVIAQFLFFLAFCPLVIAFSAMHEDDEIVETSEVVPLQEGDEI
jgi:hypothetical protein